MKTTRVSADGLVRCSWVSEDAIYLKYHDEEWGRELRAQRELFEAIALEGFQAGLSWLTILKRREGFRKAFHAFEIAKVADLTQSEQDEIQQNPEVIRNRSKIEATVHNARVILEKDLNLESELWQFAPSNPYLEGAWVARTAQSDAMSKHLKQLGLKFVGSTTMHALMQATGMVRDHAPQCQFRI